MQNVYDKYELVKFELDDLNLDVKVSRSDETAWLNKEEIGILFNRNRSAIARHIEHIIDDDQLDLNRVCAKIARTGPDGKNYIVDYFNLDLVLLVGQRVKSRNGLLLKEFVDRYFSENRAKNNNLIIYNNGHLNLAVNISPEEETVWLNVQQIATLFDTSIRNVYLHIQNIYEEGEIEHSVTKDFFTTEKEMPYFAADGKQYLTTFYNLDVILAVGYRVKSKRAIEFRKWVTNVLKQYLLKGYVIDQNRTMITDENYVNLIHKVESIDTRLTTLEKRNPEISAKIFHNGEYFDARTFIKELFAHAKNNITLIDPYVDNKALDYLKIKQSDVSVNLYTSSKSHLTQDDINSFNRQFHGLTCHTNNSFHDRFIIIDKIELYHLGTSLNYLGNKTTAIVKMDSSFINDVLAKL